MGKVIPGTHVHMHTSRHEYVHVRTYMNASTHLLTGIWLNRELWVELRKKKRVCHLWKMGQATQEDYKDIVRLCREKIRRPS